MKSKNTLKNLAKLPSAFLFSSFLFAGSNAWAQTVDFNVTTSNTFSAASTPLAGVSGCGIQVGTHYYASQQFTVLSNASYTITTSVGASGTPLDTLIGLYNTAFNPSSPTTGLVACNDDISAPTNLFSSVTASLVTGTTYTIVITSFAVPATAGGTTSGGGVALTGDVKVTFTPDVTLGSATGAVTSGGTGAVSAPIDFNFNKPAETFVTEIELK